LKEKVEHITDIPNELKNSKHDVNFFDLTNYQDMFSRTEAHEAKLKSLQKNITDLQTISNSAQQLPTPGGQIKTEHVLQKEGRGAEEKKQ
jgi:CRISPR/Cas system CSM-associated protein Csm4 (group 5 of RAMP superfamily)